MQKNPLEQKVALITGAARRIGATTAYCLHAAGMNMVVHYNESDAEANALCAHLNRQRENSAVSLGANLSTVEEPQQLIEKAANVWGRLDVLVNNASRFYRTHLGGVTEHAWGDLMNSNLRAPFFLSQAAAPHLAATQGCIINITDIHGERPMRDYSVYCISKAGLLMMTKVLAKELGPSVRVNAVSPGAIIWPEGENTLSESEKQNIIDGTVLKRAGDPEDIAKAVLYFVRDADYLTGQVLDVDGGRKLTS